MTYPIILAHGITRFDVVTNRLLNAGNSNNPILDNLHYFKGIGEGDGQSVGREHNRFLYGKSDQ